jgi:hypothetical protein
MPDVRSGSVYDAAQTPRPPREVDAAWEALDRLYLQDATVPHVAGARAAAEWTTGRTAMSPITNVHEPPVGLRVRGEGHAAGMVALGRHPGDRGFATGAMGWMFWWVGLEPLPAWIRVHL